MADDRSKRNGRRGIATLSDIGKRQDSDSDSDGPQEYYTGGEKSGMMVQDPSKNFKKKDLDSFFESARQHVPAASSSANGSFSGTGRTLAGDVREQAPPPAEPVMHTINLWRNGFSVDDGPLRSFDDPTSAPFLRSIANGEAPRELGGDHNAPVDVNLVRRDEDYKVQAPAAAVQRAFQGTGRTLGNSQSLPSVAAATTAAAAAPLASAEPFRGIVVDEKKPFTSLQLRLADGTRMVARFNHHHTVADVRGFINAARTDGPRSYVLQAMGFPPKPLDDASLTIEAAGLMNAVVIQKL